MKTWKKKTIKTVDDVRCDACGQSTTRISFAGPDYASLKASWGYGSNNDGSIYDIELCESCFFEVLDFIKNKRREVLGPFNYPYNNDPLKGMTYL